jgi:magnesium transporter
MTNAKKQPIKKLLKNRSIKYRPSFEEISLQKLQQMSNEELSQMHPADICEIISDVELTLQIQVLKRLSHEQAAEVLCELPEEQQILLSRTMGLEPLKQLLEAMPSDEAADLMALFSPEKVDQLLAVMKEENRNETIEFLCYAEDSAGRAMAKELVDFFPETTAAEAMEMLNKKFERQDFFSYLYITGHDHVLCGVISLRELILASPESRMQDLMQTAVVSVDVEEDQEKAAYLATKYDLAAIPVVDKDKTLVGIITREDIREIIEEEHEEDLYRMAGLNEAHESLPVNPLQAAFYRLPFLTLTAFGGLAASMVIDKYVREEFVWLMAFSPLILGLAGNIGIQISTTIVRELSLRQFSQEPLPLRYFIRQFTTGVCLSLLCGILLGTIISIIKGAAVYGIIVGCSMFAVIILSSIASTLTPVLFQRLKIDPAIASGPLVTTMTDACGMLIYFNVSYLLLRFLPTV